MFNQKKWWWWLGIYICVYGCVSVGNSSSFAADARWDMRALYKEKGKGKKFQSFGEVKLEN